MPERAMPQRHFYPVPNRARTIPLILPLLFWRLRDSHLYGWPDRIYMAPESASKDGADSNRDLQELLTQGGTWLRWVCFRLLKWVKSYGPGLSSSNFQTMVLQAHIDLVGSNTQ